MTFWIWANDWMHWGFGAAEFLAVFCMTWRIRQPLRRKLQRDMSVAQAWREASDPSVPHDMGHG